MKKSDRQPKNRLAGRVPLRLSLALFALFFLDVLAGKMNVQFAWGLPQLGSVKEFLLLAVASTFLIVAALARETAEKEPPNQKTREVQHETGK